MVGGPLVIIALIIAVIIRLERVHGRYFRRSERGNMKNGDIPEEQPVIPDKLAWSLVDKWYGDEWTDMGGMNQRNRRNYS